MYTLFSNSNVIVVWWCYTIQMGREVLQVPVFSSRHFQLHAAGNAKDLDLRLQSRDTLPGRVDNTDVDGSMARLRTRQCVHCEETHFSANAVGIRDGAEFCLLGITTQSSVKQSRGREMVWENCRMLLICGSATEESRTVSAPELWIMTLWIMPL